MELGTWEKEKAREVTVYTTADSVNKEAKNST